MCAEFRMCLSAPEDACIWDAQGGPDSTGVKNDPYYNQWEDLDDSPIGWHITEVRLKLLGIWQWGRQVTEARMCDDQSSDITPRTCGP